MSKPSARVGQRYAAPGRITVLSFIGFSCGFAAIAALLEKASPSARAQATSPERLPLDDEEPSFGDPYSSNPASAATDARNTPASNSNPKSGPAQALDPFNRLQRYRTPWVLKRYADATEVQLEAARRLAMLRERNATQRDRRAVARQRQQELDRFTESRKMAYESMVSGYETPRGREPDRQVPDVSSRQRSMSSASSASSSSRDDW